MMDISDGLASDLWRIAEASRVSLVVDEEQIPVSRAAGSVWHALMDGEDFELLFTLRPAVARRLCRTRPSWVRMTEIGTVVGRGAAVRLRRGDGRMRVLRPEGYRHF